MKRATLILAAAIIVVLILVAGKLLLSDLSFSPANPGWDGISAVAMANGVIPLYSFDQLQHAGMGDTLLVIGPSVKYTEEETRQTSDFLLSGGQAIVMDDYGTGGSLLESLGSPILLEHTPLCQDGDYYLSYSLPLARKVANDSILANVNVLAFNHPVALQTSENSTERVRTSSLGWMDYNDNGRFDGNETFDSYAVMASASYGKGKLVVAGDADLLINRMLEVGDNRVLLDNIKDSGTVYLDIGHGQQVPPLASLYYIIKYNAIAQIICAIIIFVIGMASIAWGRARKKEAPEEAGDGPGPLSSKRSLVAAMRERLPLTARDIQVLNKKL
jgi:hypothetical protein